MYICKYGCYLRRYQLTNTPKTQKSNWKRNANTDSNNKQNGKETAFGHAAASVELQCSTSAVARCSCSCCCCCRVARSLALSATRSLCCLPFTLKVSSSTKLVCGRVCRTWVEFQLSREGDREKESERTSVSKWACIYLYRLLMMMMIIIKHDDDLRLPITMTTTIESSQFGRQLTAPQSLF